MWAKRDSLVSSDLAAWVGMWHQNYGGISSRLSPKYNDEKHLQYIQGSVFHHRLYVG